MGVTIDAPDSISRQSILCGKIDKLLTIVAGKAAARPKPHQTIGIATNINDKVTRQSILCGEVSEFLTIVSR